VDRPLLGRRRLPLGGRRGAERARGRLGPRRALLRARRLRDAGRRRRPARRMVRQRLPDPAGLPLPGAGVLRPPGLPRGLRAARHRVLPGVGGGALVRAGTVCLRGRRLRSGDGGQPRHAALPEHAGLHLGQAGARHQPELLDWPGGHPDHGELQLGGRQQGHLPQLDDGQPGDPDGPRAAMRCLCPVRLHLLWRVAESRLQHAAALRLRGPGATAASVPPGVRLRQWQLLGPQSRGDERDER